MPDRIIMPFAQEQPDDVEAWVVQVLGARTEHAEHGLVECGAIIVNQEGEITETHWFKVLQS